MHPQDGDGRLDDEEPGVTVVEIEPAPLTGCAQTGGSGLQAKGSAEWGSPLREGAGPGGTGRAPRHRTASSSSGTLGPAVPLGARPGLEMGVPTQLHL